MKKIMFSFLIVLAVVCFFGMNTKTIYADQNYVYQYKKVKIKKEGFYYLSNKDKSKKANTNIYMTKKKSSKEKYILPFPTNNAMGIPRGGRVLVYLKKGVYYIAQELGEYDISDKKMHFNKKTTLKYAGKNADIIKENSYFSVAGDIKNKTVYLKLKAAKSGVIEVSDKNVTLCDARKKELSRKSKGEDDRFGIQKGNTYYLKLTNMKRSTEIKYEYWNSYGYEHNFDNVIYGKSKGNAVSLNSFYSEGSAWVRGLVGLHGAEEHWYVYENQGSEGTTEISYKIMDLCGKQKDGVEIHVYDPQGREAVREGEEWKRIYYPVELKTGEKAYVQVKAKAGSPAMYDLNVH
ncbi:hypothetical protein AALA00_10490 [Lachnospiraceae bacterium 46-15]